MAAAEQGPVGMEEGGADRDPHLRTGRGGPRATATCEPILADQRIAEGGHGGGHYPSEERPMPRPPIVPTRPTVGSQEMELPLVALVRQADHCASHHVWTGGVDLR